MNKRSCYPSNEGRASRARTARGWLAAGLIMLGAWPATADSLWKDDVVKPMFADKRAGNVGDILTIVIQENSSASKDNNTSTSRKSTQQAAISSFLFSPGASGLMTQKGQLPSMGYGSQGDFNGGGTIKNNETITANVAVRVVDVLPNKNLVIEGTRDTAFSGEAQTMVLRGIVRQDDISGNNTVFSYNISDATIKIVAKGNLADTQKKGWFTRIWDKVNPM